ncbi:hypothetical protein ACQBAR_12190 [Propionibacteriaceae bacterium Y1685]
MGALNPELGPAMPAVPQPTVPQPAAAGRPRRLATRVRRYLQSVLIMVLVTPVREGRLRNVGWPPGLQPIVWIAYGLAAACAVLVLLSEPLRATWSLGAFDIGTAIPRATVWMMIAVIDVVLTLLALACIHGRAWLTVIGMITVVLATGLSGIYAVPFSMANPLPLLILFGLIIGIVVSGILWHRNPLRWWEFPVLFAQIAAFSVVNLIMVGRSAVPLGMDLAPNSVYSTVTLLGFLCLPMGLAAGTAAAEITTATALRGSSQLTRIFRPRVVVLTLVAVIIVRIAQSAWEVTHLDPVSRSPQTMITTVAYAVLMVGLAAVVLGVRRREHGPVVVPDVPPAGTGLGLPVGFMLLIMMVPIGVGIVLLVMVVSLVPELANDTVNQGLASSDLIHVGSRTVMIIVMTLWCIRRLRRGDRATALVAGMVAILLLGVPIGHLIGYAWPTHPDLDTLLLMLTVVVLMLTTWWAVRRRLSLRRIESVLAMLLITVLFAHRNLLDSPLDFLLEASSAVILFGVGWALFTGSDFANRGSAHLPVPTRVLLLLAYTLTVMAVLAFNSLARIEGLGGVDLFADLGDSLLGGALVVGTLAGLFAAAVSDHPVRQDS